MKKFGTSGISGMKVIMIVVLITTIFLSTGCSGGGGSSPTAAVPSTGGTGNGSNTPAENANWKTLYTVSSNFWAATNNIQTAYKSEFDKIADWFSNILSTTAYAGTDELQIFAVSGISWTENGTTTLRLIACAGKGKMVYSDDNGVTWNPMPTGISETLYDMTFNSNNIGVSVGGGPLVSEKRILRTLDHGDHWQNASISSHENSQVLCFVNVIVATDGLHMVAMSLLGIAISNNAGVTWQCTGRTFENDGTGGTYLSAGRSVSYINPNNPYEVLAINNSGILVKTTDLFATEGNTSPLLTLPGATEALWCVTPTHWFAAGSRVWEWDGNNWKERTDILPTGGIASAYIRKIYFVDANTGFMMGDGGLILTTLDGGANWALIVAPVGEPVNNINVVKGSGQILQKTIGVTKNTIIEKK